MKRYDSAVSPVIAVMLMLVVTIIIAAVVSGFAGSLVNTNNQKAPTLTMDVKIINTGSWVGSGFYATVTGTSEPIRTKDLNMVTRWRATSRADGTSSVSGGGYSNHTPNVNCWVGMKTTAVTISGAPYGIGNGVNGSVNQLNPEKYSNMWFGNYSLMGGTNMYAYPYGTDSGMAIGTGTSGASSTDSGYGIVTPYTYTYGSNYTATQFDSMEAVLGKNWQNLAIGNTVDVAVVHLPSGKTIYQQNIPVSGA